MAHLVVVAHGMWGKAQHTSFIVEEITRLYPAAFVCMNSVSNEQLLSYDGIQRCGERLAAEVNRFVDGHTAAVKRVSFVGYSAGGLFVRFAVGVLHAEGFFDRVAPMHLITIATPHTGQPVAIKKIPWRRLRRTLADIYGGQTMKEILMCDQGDTCRLPMLQLLSSPGTPFYDALSRFAQLSCYANVHNDRTVPYETAALSEYNVHQYSAAASPKDAYVASVTFTNCADTEKYRRDSVLAARASESLLSRCSALLRTALLWGVICTLVLPVHVLIVLPAALCVRLYIALRHNSGARRSEAYTKAALHDKLAACPDAVPMTIAERRSIMLSDLQRLRWKRVDVSLPGVHNHGVIIYRRRSFWFAPGKLVVAHVVEGLTATPACK
jgi:hypothetical protein